MIRQQSSCLPFIHRWMFLNFHKNAFINSPRRKASLLLRIWGCFLKPFLNGWDVTPAQCICFTLPLFSIQLIYPEMDVHNAFVIGYLNSVTNPASVDRHQRSHHPSIDFSLWTPFPIILYQDSDCWFTWCSSTGLLKPHTHTHTHREVLYCPGWHLWAFSSLSVWSLCFDSGLFLSFRTDICCLLTLLALDTLLLSLLWYPCYRPLPVRRC